MSKKLLAALIALSMVGAYACSDSESEEGNGGAVGDACTATVCENGSLKICAGNKIAKIDTCANGCAADGKKCADANQPGCTAHACKDATTLNYCINGSFKETPCPNGCDMAKNECKAAANCTKKAEDCQAGTKLDTASCACLPDGTACKCADGSACPGGDITKCAGTPQECKCGDGSACPDNDITKCTVAPECKCTDGSACPDGDITKCAGTPQECKCGDGSACPDNDITKCAVAPECKCDDGSACPDGDKTKCSGAPVDCKCDDGSACPNGDKTKCAATGDDPKEGDPCAADTYEGACSKDGKTGFYCDKEGKLVSKPCEGDKTCKVKGKNSVSCDAPLPAGVPESCEYGTSKGICVDNKGYSCKNSNTYAPIKCEGTCFECPDEYWVGCGASVEAACEGHMTKKADCTADSKEACNKACTKDKSAGYYWSNTDKKVNEVKCEKKDCTTKNGKVECESEISAGEACDYSKDKTKSCTDANTAKYCGNDNKWHTKPCNSCTLNADSTYYCCDGNNDKCSGTSTEKEDCKADSKEKCNAACTTDKKTGYYWSSDKVLALECTDKQECRKSGASNISCISKELPAECSGSVCGEDGNAYFCDLENKLFYIDKNNGICTAEKACKVCVDGYGGCGTDCAKDDHDKKCTEPKATTKGAVNACCDSLEYMPSCNGKTLNYCRSWGKVETKTCATTCSVDENTKRYTCK